MVESLAAHTGSGYEYTQVLDDFLLAVERLELSGPQGLFEIAVAAVGRSLIAYVEIVSHRYVRIFCV